MKYRFKNLAVEVLRHKMHNMHTYTTIFEFPYKIIIYQHIINYY